MKFAKYWESVEIPVSEKVFGRSRISTWGASNDNPESARRSAKDRAGKLRAFIDSGFDRNSEYEYWNGYIREEILEEVTAENGDVLAVLTRNSYGATVLNTETVVFGDIDITEPGLIVRLLEKFGKRKKDKNYFLERIGAFHNNNSHFSIKVYETFAGLRFVITNKTAAPEDAAILEMFNALQVDPMYMRLCKQQTCFRARLTPKPWRIGIDRPKSRFPRAIDKDQREFETWLRQYESASARKAAARLIKEFGSDRVHRDVRTILDIHDRYACDSRADLA